MLHTILRISGVALLGVGATLFGCAHQEAREQFASEHIPYAAPPKPIGTDSTYRLGTADFAARRGGAAIESASTQHAIVRVPARTEEESTPTATADCVQGTTVECIAQAGPGTVDREGNLVLESAAAARAD